MITEKRIQKLYKVAAQRQHFTVVLENVHDPHNIGAIMRTCDAVGIQELYILYTEDRLTEEKLDQVKSSATGVRKWLDIYFYKNPADCFTAIKKKYDKILATHLGQESVSLYDLDLTANIALLFGNEHEGISEEALSYADGNYIIPQHGMVGSLNISVACAISLFEASRQRIEAGLYNEDIEQIDPERKNIAENFIAIHKARYNR